MMFMVVFLMGLASGLANQSAGTLKTLPVSDFILRDDAELLLAESSLAPETVDQLAPQVKGQMTPFSIERSAIKVSEESEKLELTYFVVEGESFLFPDLESVEDLTNQEQGVILSQSFEEEGIQVGDQVIDAKSEQLLTVVGFMENQSYAFSPVALINFETQTKMRQALNPAYKESYQSLALAEPQASLDEEGIELATKDQVVDKVPGYSAQQITINLISWVLLFVSAAILGIFFYIITLQKRQQFGVMKAIGISLGEIIGMQFSQGFFLALFGVGLGNLLALGTMSILPDVVPVLVDFKSALLASVVFVSMAVLSILLSCLQIAKIDPVKIIGGGDA